MEDYANRFLELLRYVPYIRDEKVKMQCFLSGIPQSYQDRIEFDEPKNLEETIQKVKYCYEQAKHKLNSSRPGRKRERINLIRGRKASSLNNIGTKKIILSQVTQHGADFNRTFLCRVEIGQQSQQRKSQGIMERTSEMLGMQRREFSQRLPT
jgi:hypothetical protein